MSRLSIRLLFVSILIVLLACEPQVEEPDPDDREDDDVAVCLQGEPFVGDGSIPIEVAESGDAHMLSELRWEAHEGCERLVIDFTTEDGEPATAPGEVSTEVLRELGVVRVSLRDVEWVDPDATEAEFGGELARQAYSVWSPEGRWVYVDVHLAHEAEVYANVLEDPARVVIDLRPGGGAIPEPAPAQQQVVVLEPRPGEASYPLTITGYARTFEANVVARIEQDGEEVDETFTTATAWADAWGHYEITFEEGPSGLITLHVGEYSAKDGTWEGVAVELEMESR